MEEAKGLTTTSVVLTPVVEGSTGGLPRYFKIILVAIAAGVSIGLITRYFRRSSRRMKRTLKGSVVAKEDMGDVPDGYHLSMNKSLSASLSPRPGHGAAIIHDRASVTSSILTQSTLVSNSVADIVSGLTCTQLGILGMETLEKSVVFWDESLHLLRIELDSGLAEHEEEHCLKTIRQLENIIDAARRLQHLAEELYLDEGSVLYAESERASYGRLRAASSVESFMSAEDFLSEDEDIRHSLESAGFLSNQERGDGVYPLYEAAMRLVEAGAVPHRSLKTEMVGCKNGDKEYLAKLHCLRGAFSRIISDTEKRHWIYINGREVFSDILVKADRDPLEFEVSYNAIVAWSQDSGNWGLIENELKDRGLRALTFYDIVLDYIFLDAFEDLESPPASVLAVTQNRWLSNSFKENALGTAVWSVLRTKRKWLRYSEGFMAHFYTLSEQIMPTLAWGFLGPSTSIQELCFYFKDKFLEFLNAIFSFEGVRYTTLDDLAEDVMKKLELMHSSIVKKIVEIPTPT